MNQADQRNTSGDTPPLLSIRDLRVSFRSGSDVNHAVQGVSFDVHAGETVAVVGESGSGKSVTAMTVLRLVPTPPAAIEGGRVLYRPATGEAIDTLTMDAKQLRELRGGDIAMIFQEPMTSLNPVMNVGDQVIEAIRIHQRLSRRDAQAAAVEAFAEVGIENAKARLRDYPHQFSGGMRQRVMIAIALACRSRVLIADEPTTALDVTIQAQILDLIDRLRVDRDLGVILITHDLGLVAQRASRVVVMYAGRVVETGPTPALFDQPQHPYTEALLKWTPDLNARKDRLASIGGVVTEALERQDRSDLPWWPGRPESGGAAWKDAGGGRGWLTMPRIQAATVP